jgi:hypothetical protein
MAPSSETVKLVQVSTASRADLAPALENGNILFFSHTPFELSSQDRHALLSIADVPGAHHKNIAFKPRAQKVTGLSHVPPHTRAAVENALKSYSEWAIQFVAGLLPAYADGWQVDYASFRPVEEENRELPWKKRNDLIHTDAFPSRPTHGGLILRFFTNLNPSQDRVWVVGRPFAAIAPEHALPAGLLKFAAQTRSPFRRAWSAMLPAARTAGLPITDRSPYDRFMLAFHDYLKANQIFQQNCPKSQFRFPPGSSWMVFTDVVPHSVISGQYALEQTFIVSPDTLSSREHAPISILESISGTLLAPKAASAR